MDVRRMDKIRGEMKKAEEFLQAAELLQTRGLYTQSATSSCYAAYHAALAAFLASGVEIPKETYQSFAAMLERFSHKLDPYIEKVKAEWKSFGLNAGLEYAENESQLKLYQAREFFLEVKDFLRRAVK